MSLYRSQWLGSMGKSQCEVEDIKIYTQKEREDCMRVTETDRERDRDRETNRQSETETHTEKHGCYWVLTQFPHFLEVYTAHGWPSSKAPGTGVSLRVNFVEKWDSHRKPCLTWRCPANTCQPQILPRQVSLRKPVPDKTSYFLNLPARWWQHWNTCYLIFQILYWRLTPYYL